MKKIIISLFGVFMALGAIAQPTFVSTSPSNKNVVLEEYTGTNCPISYYVFVDFMCCVILPMALS